MTKNLSTFNHPDKNFFNDVYEVVKLIPVGKVTSYGAIAKYLGAKGSARVVGWAMKSAHGLHDVPAHRVVNRVGLLTGKHHYSSPEEMRERLEAEGVMVSENQVVGFNEVFWDPNVELD